MPGPDEPNQNVPENEPLTNGSVLRPPADEVLSESSEVPESTAKTEHDEPVQAEKSVVMDLSFKEKVKNWFIELWQNPRRRYAVLGTMLVILIALFVVPVTRYNILGLVLKSQATVTVIDSKTGQPVSGAAVELGGQKSQTDASGKATLYPKMGSKTLVVSKKFYQSYSQKELVAMAASHNTFKAKLTALGQHVQVKLVDKISNQPLGGATIKAQGAQAKTNTSGLATVVIDSGSGTVSATVTLSGYNRQTVTLKADSSLGQNTFAVTPSGKVYFLSNLSGDIDVVKTNLDGSDRETVLTGTGNEDHNNTSLLASRDWKYLALLAKRDGATASVYLIDTTNGDKLTTIDQGDATFTLVGWSGDTFVYEVAKNNWSNWQPNGYALKSYDATTGRTTLLDQSQAEGTSANDYGYTAFSSIYILDNEIFYAKNWLSSYPANHLAGKSSSLTSIRADGSGHKVIKTFPVPDGSQYYSINLAPYEPYGVYVQVPDGTSNTYYKYEDGSLSSTSSVTDQQFSDVYPTFLISPSASNTFWADQRDGKNTLFVGNKDGGSGKQIATLSDYNPYGWYTDNYLLVSKNSSELYILPKTGGKALKVSDYYKPPINYNGYGGGYGGL